MSETADNGREKPVSMFKLPRVAGASTAKPPVPNQPLPLTMRVVFGAMAAVVVGSIIRVIAIGLASKSSLTPYLVYANSKAKTPKKPYTPAELASDVHAIRVGTVSNAILLGVLMIALFWGLRRARSAWMSRWLAVIALVLTQSFLYVIPQKHLLGLANVGGVIIGLASIVAILGLFVPPSSKYIADCRELSLPPERRGQPRPKLFGPRAEPAARTAGPSARSAGPSTRSVQANNSTERTASAASGKAKAKARSDAEAVARGAELARTRARASKSRRSDV